MPEELECVNRATFKIGLCGSFEFMTKVAHSRAHLLPGWKPLPPGGSWEQLGQNSEGASCYSCGFAHVVWVLFTVCRGFLPLGVQAC